MLTPTPKPMPPGEPNHHSILPLMYIISSPKLPHAISLGPFQPPPLAPHNAGTAGRCQFTCPHDAGIPIPGPTAGLASGVPNQVPGVNLAGPHDTGIPNPLMPWMGPSHCQGYLAASLALVLTTPASPTTQWPGWARHIARAAWQRPQLPAWRQFTWSPPCRHPQPPLPPMS